MKTVILLGMGLALTVLVGCASPRGGRMSSDEGFKIVTPPLTTSIKQGERKTVKFNLDRGKYFKEDVRLDIRGVPKVSGTTQPVVAASSSNH